MLSSLKFEMKELAMTEYNIAVGKNLLPELLCVWLNV